MEDTHNCFLRFTKLYEKKIYRISTFFLFFLNYQFERNISSLILKEKNSLRLIKTKELIQIIDFKKNYFSKVENIILHGIMHNYYENLEKENMMNIISTNDNYFKYKTILSFLKNTFLSEKTKENIVIFISKIQRNYFALKKFVNICKEKSSEISIDIDMYFNKISDKSNNCFKVYQNKKIYYFTVCDLIKIIETSLCNCMYSTFVVQPIQPKNPYNNIEFSTSVYYNLYNHIRYKTIINIPIILELWKSVSFQKTILFLKYERFLRKIAIKNYVWNTTDKELYYDIREMLLENTQTRKWNISKKFPNKVLQDKFKHYVYIYYLINYDCVEESEICLYETYLKEGLDKCYSSNKNFGNEKQIIIGFNTETKLEYDTNVTTNFNSKNF